MRKIIRILKNELKISGVFFLFLWTNLIYILIKLYLIY